MQVVTDIDSELVLEMREFLTDSTYRVDPEPLGPASGLNNPRKLLWHLTSLIDSAPGSRWTYSEISESTGIELTKLTRAFGSKPVRRFMESQGFFLQRDKSPTSNHTVTYLVLGPTQAALSAAI